MQPTYLPWAGYFNLIDQVDKFIFLDDVQFERQSWQSRNRIALNGEEHLLSISVKNHHLDSNINQIQIANNLNWRKKTWLCIESAYKKSPYGDQVLGLLEPFYRHESEINLSNFNENIIKNISYFLGLQTIFYRSSQLSCEGDRTIRLINICNAVECNEYLSPIGSKDYLVCDGFNKNEAGIALHFQNFKPASYAQFRCKKFIEKLSVIDVIANLGADRAKIYIGQGYL